MVLTFIDAMNIESIDLNLLLAFEAVYQEKNVSRAAKRIGLTQPALSSALSRLRALLDDPLFYRTAAGMSPTPRARELARPVLEALSQLRRALTPAGGFEPGEARRQFVIATNDYAEVRVLAPLLRRLEEEAPRVEVQVVRVDNIFAAPVEMLAEGECHLALGFYPPFDQLPPGLHSMQLRMEDNVVLAGRERKRMEIDEFMAASHAAVFYRREGGPGLIDRLLAEEGLRRVVAVSSPHFLSIPLLIAGTNKLACVPEGLPPLFPKLELYTYPLPFDFPLFTMRLIWHERTHNDAALRWVRAQVAEVAFLPGR